MRKSGTNQQYTYIGAISNHANFGLWTWENREIDPFLVFDIGAFFAAKKKAATSCFFRLVATLFRLVAALFRLVAAFSASSS
ncbi:MAG: hypothetical protein P4M14_01345 [Gammaproteobacteria bacterium]|nr:hypothetical protein [Gammaproteobacteria bacterium]